MPRPGERKTVAKNNLIVASDVNARSALSNALRVKAGKAFVIEEALQIQTLRQIKQGRHKGKYSVSGRGVYRVPHTYKG
jgi:hypothetical protein